LIRLIIITANGAKNKLSSILLLMCSIVIVIIDEQIASIGFMNNEDKIDANITEVINPSRFFSLFSGDLILPIFPINDATPSPNVKIAIEADIICFVGENKKAIVHPIKKVTKPKSFFFLEHSLNILVYIGILISFLVKINKNIATISIMRNVRILIKSKFIPIIKIIPNKK